MLVIAAAADSDDPRCRAAALGARRRQECLGLDHLIDALDDVHEIVQIRALSLIAAGEAPEGSSPAIIERLLTFTPANDEVEETVAFTFGELGHDDVRIIAWLSERVSSHPDALVREAAVAALGALHAGREVILAALSDRATVRRRAIIALAPFEGEDIDAALQHALTDRDWQVRQAAEDLLAP